MLFNKDKNPFKNNGVIEYILKINKDYIDPDGSPRKVDPSTSYIKESDIVTDTSKSHDDIVLHWLWRIERYFLVPEIQMGENDKEATKILIGKFLKDFLILAPAIQAFLSTDKEALNCLNFTLSLIKNRNIRSQVKPVINSYQTESVPSAAASQSTFFQKKPVEEIQQLFINKQQIPSRLIQLIKELQQSFAKSLWYLTGSAPANILDEILPNDYDLIAVNVSLPEIQQFLGTKGLKGEIRGQKFPILCCDLGEGVWVDFAVRSTQNLSAIDTLLKNDFYIRDFNLNALYCQLTTADEFPVFSFDDALKARQHKQITSIADPDKTFKQDPTRLFRLAKLMISYPNYRISDELRKSLTALRPKLIVLLENYAGRHVNNRFRLDQSIKKLFARATYSEINEAFDRLGVLNIFSGNNLANANEACSRIPIIGAKDKWFFWIAANILKSYTLGNSNGWSPLYHALWSTQQEQDWYRYINSICPGQQLQRMQYFNLQLLELIESFNLTTSINFSP